MAKSKAKKVGKKTASKNTSPKKSLKAAKSISKTSSKKANTKSTVKKTAKASTKKKMTAKKTVKKTGTKPVTQSVVKTKATKKPITKLNKSIAKKSSVKVAKTNSNKTFNWSQMLTPLDDRLLVEVISGERMTPGGLIIPDTVSMTGQKKGKVVVVGRGHRSGKGHVRPMDVQIGDQVLFEEYSGTEIEIMGQKVLMLRESEVLGIEA